MTVLPGDPQGASPDHQVPAHRGMPRDVRTAVPDGREPTQGPLPAYTRVLQVAERLSTRLEEQEVVADLARLTEQAGK